MTGIPILSDAVLMALAREALQLAAWCLKGLTPKNRLMPGEQETWWREAWNKTRADQFIAPRLLRVDASILNARHSS